MRFALAPILTPGLWRSVSDHRASSAWCVARKTTRGARLASNASGQRACAQTSGAHPTRRSSASSGGESWNKIANRPGSQIGMQCSNHLGALADCRSNALDGF
jgi:hypothetical protein